MGTVSGSTTLYRGLPSSVTERWDLVLDFPLKAAQTVYKGQALIYDQSNNQATTPTAGVNEASDTNGTVRAATNSDSYQTMYVGICVKNIDDSDTTAPEYGTRIAPILMRGITLLRAVVNDTDGSDGYDTVIGGGDLCAVGGGAGGGTITGSNTVTGFTALTPGAYFLNPTGATDGSGNMPIGWFLDFQNGSTADHTISDGTATIAATQAEDPSTWLRVYVDMFAASFAGGTAAKFTV
jgi:hypothetical protein